MGRSKEGECCVSVFGIAMVVIFSVIVCGMVGASPALGTMDQTCPTSCECRDNMTIVTCSNLDTIEHIDIPATVTTLNLQNNFFKSDFTLSSRNIPELKVLDLSHNRINPLQGNAFINLRKLTHLILHDNHLQKFDDDTFRETIKLEVLDISYNRFKSIPDKPFRHLVNLRSLNISYNMVDSLVFGLRFQVLTQLEMLDFSRNPIRNVQSGAFEMASEWEERILRHLNLSFCKITVVESQAFSIPGLTSLNLEGNPNITSSNLSEIIQEMHSSKLKQLNLANMNISAINQVFGGREQLPVVEISFAHNEISELPLNISFYLQHLERLHLEHNKISSLGQPFDELVRLKYLDVSYNSVDRIDVNLSKTLNNLEFLILSHNYISEIDLDLSEFSNLEHLDLSSNNLSSIVIPSDLVNLDYINLARNRISSLNTFSGLPALRYFDISSNMLTSLNSFVFVGAHGIEFANFSQNSLNALSHQAFRPHTPQVIDLSSNRLTRIMNCGWHETKVLKLQNNSISNIDRHTFFHMMSLELLDMSRNNVTDMWEDLFMFLTNLTELFFQDNNLSFRPKTLSKLLRPLKKLQTINLSANELESLDKTVFLGLNDLVSVAVSNNKLSHVTSDVFNELPTLRLLDLTNNPFECDCGLLDLQRWIRSTKVRLSETECTSYLCGGPARQTGKTIMNFEMDVFECNTILLYVTVIGSVGGFLMVIAAVTAALCHYYHKCRQSKIETTKAKVLKYLSMNGHFLNMVPMSNGVGRNGVIQSKRSPRQSMQTEDLRGWKTKKSRNQKSKNRSYSLETDLSNRTANSRRLSSLFPLKSNLKNKKCRRFSDIGVLESKGVRFRHRPHSRSHQSSLDMSNISENGSRNGRRISLDHHRLSRDHRNSTERSTTFAKANLRKAVNSDIIRYPYPPRATDSTPDMMDYVSSISRTRRSRLPVVHVDSPYSKNRSMSWVADGNETLFPYVNRTFSSLDRPKVKRIETNGIQTLGRRKSRPSIGSRSVYI